MTNEDIATELLDELARSYGYDRCSLVRFRAGFPLEVVFVSKLVYSMQYKAVSILENNGNVQYLKVDDAASAVRLLYSAISVGDKVMAGTSLLDKDNSGIGKFMVDCVLKGLT